MKAVLQVPKYINYADVGLVVGLEIHQQLDTKTKLFCNCGTKLVKEHELNQFQPIIRYLRATRSELGEIDTAAAFETQRGRKYLYKAPDAASCLVELDEEPPHELNREALIIAIAIAKALNSMVVDEVHVMRKIVVDGSNTTGFQRTAIIALGGYIMDEEGVIRIQTIALEEDAARKIGEDFGSAIYSLDRLGIPLIEISTAPDIKTPEQAKRVAEKIGFLLRLTGKVKRGIGTIRQDLNLSIKGSPKIEIKGIQKLELIPKVIQEETRRLIGLLMIRDELIRRGAKVEEIMSQIPIDITEYLKDCSSNIIQSGLRKGYRVFAIKLPFFDGLLGVELQTNRRFGSELADYARQWSGVKGIIHSDELPSYGINEDNVNIIKKVLNLRDKDAFVLIVDEPEKALKAFEIIKERACQALYGIPKETRGANDDGTTRYLRPQPGAARMYPETDVPPIKIDNELLAESEKLIPPPIEVKLEQLTKKYGLSTELAKQILYSEYLNIFEELIKTYNVEPKLIATLLTSIFGELKSEGLEVSVISDDHLHMIVKVIETYNIRDKDSIKNIISAVIKNPAITYNELSKITSSAHISENEIRAIVMAKIFENIETVKIRGEKAFQFIMGKVMNELRGRADGKIVASIVKEELAKVLSKMAQQ
ncbi:MAG: Glu-tRNA(Gln) amidotransferase subunit GatE [Ignisphaera sp.]